MKKHLSLFLSAAVSASIFLCAENALAFSGAGAGTETSPYIITSADQLDEVRNELTAYYRLGADIDLSAWIATNSPLEGWLPIGFSGSNDVAAATPFKGSLDGAGHVISGLWVNRPASNFVGLFGQVTGIVSFKNLGIIIAEGKSVSGRENVGAIAGWLTNIETTNRAEFKNCFVIGDVTGEKAVGGLVGLANWMHPTVENCYAAGTISSNAGSHDGLGGLIGSSWGNVEINMTHSYAVNALLIDAGSGAAGGLMGSASANSASGIVLNISDNLAINAAIDAPTAKRIIGYIKSGANLHLANYAYAGTLLNGNDEWFGELENDGGQDADLKEVVDPEFYTGIGWDLQNVWTLGNGNYPLPVLKNFPANVQPSTALSHVPSTGNSIAQVADLQLQIICTRDGQLIIKNQPLHTVADIYDLSGRLLVHNAGSSVSGLVSGVYIVKAGPQVVKIVK